MKFTHKKKNYFAVCLQWSEYNTQEVVDLIQSTGAEVTPYSGRLMIRWQNPLNYKCSLDTIDVGDWVRKGENGVLKLMKDPEFQLKYEILK